MDENMILQNVITLIIMFCGFIGTSLYLRGNISARLDSHDKYLQQNGESIKSLFDKADNLQKCKAEQSEIIIMKSELRQDLLSFKDDMRTNIKEFKIDVQNDINNVLKAIKSNGKVL